MSKTSPDTEGRFLSAVPQVFRNRVRDALCNPKLGGRGLRAWLAITDVEERTLPNRISIDLINIYLSDSEAEPLHDCEECGVPIPVKAGRRAGHEPSCDRVYFTACPQCGGRTGPHAFWSRSCS
jgi:hypothetical protein